jgi:hypothetical protein
MNRTNLFLDDVYKKVSIAEPNDFYLHQRIAEFRYILGRQQSPSIYDTAITNIKKEINTLLDEDILTFKEMSTGKTHVIDNAFPIAERVRFINELRLLKEKDGK